MNAYVMGEVDYAQFRAWFVGAYVDHAQVGESEELGLCRAVESQIADFSDGFASEDELRNALALACAGILPVQQMVQVATEGVPQEIVTGTSTVLFPAETAVGRSVGVGRALEYA